MQRISDAERRRRMVVRHHLDGSAASVRQACADIVAMHSSDPVTPFLALRARITGITRDDIEQALYDDRAVWRLHAMRRTIFLVDPIDADLLYLAAGRKIAMQERRRIEKWVAASLADPEMTQELDIPAGAAADPAGWMAALEARTVEVVAVTGPAATTDLRQTIDGLQLPVVMGSGKYTQTSPLASRILYLLAMDGRIVRGRPAGTWRASQYGWWTPEAWFGDGLPDLQAYGGASAAAPSAAAQRAALQEAARRYLRAHGPCEVDDLAWFYGWTKTATRTALDGLDLIEVDTDAGPAIVLAEDRDPTPAADAPVLSIVPSLDPAVMGWKRRDFYLAELAELKGPMFDYAGNSGPAILVDGWVVGGWAQRKDGEVVHRLLREVGSDIAAGIEAELADLQDWLGPDPVTTRFPSPLHKALTA